MIIHALKTLSPYLWQLYCTCWFIGQTTAGESLESSREILGVRKVNQHRSGALPQRSTAAFRRRKVVSLWLSGSVGDSLEGVSVKKRARTLHRKGVGGVGCYGHGLLWISTCDDRTHHFSKCSGRPVSRAGDITCDTGTNNQVQPWANRRNCKKTPGRSGEKIDFHPRSFN